jgi:hypothetical protein
MTKNDQQNPRIDLDDPNLDEDPSADELYRTLERQHEEPSTPETTFSEAMRDIEP